ncbi:DUF4214 domain-containing protein [Massilia oculi]|uniref:DUF4214 domain-containing protein n=1 Tax=Massilia oculi TaxID=945844 RepID=UPI0028A843A4|nr:DUF4214 domain-containing protein [Massilia oculi]
MATVSSTFNIDGVDIQITNHADANGDVTRTVVVPEITAARHDENGNDVADIPLMTIPSHAMALTAHLPTGYGLRMEGPPAIQPVSRALDMLTAQIAAHSPAADHASMIAALSAQSYWDFPTPFMLSTITPTMASDAAPDATLQLESTRGAALSAVLVDTNGQGDTAQISLSGFDITLITGAGTFEQVPGRAKIIADSASQTIIVDGGQDEVDAGGGDDRIIIGEGIADTIGHITYNILDGGEGYDTLQLNRASRDGYAFYANRNDDGDATLSMRPVDRGNINYQLSNFEALHFSEATADTSARGSVTRLHESLLDRAPDAGSLDVWMRQLAGDGTLEGLTQSILESDELAGKVPLADGAYVAWLYDQVLGRAADAGGLAYWTTSLANGELSRADLALAFVDSGEKLQMVASHELEIGASDIGVLIRMYDALYDRRPDLDGLNYWIMRSEAGASLADIADSFIAADEATGGLDDAAFVAQLYRTALERQGTALELSEWNALLANGHVDRGDVLLALVESAEMVALVGVMSTTFEVA